MQFCKLGLWGGAGCLRLGSSDRRLSPLLLPSARTKPKAVVLLPLTETMGVAMLVPDMVS